MDAATLLRTARTHSGLTQAEVGRRVGVTQAAIGRLERAGANPTVGTLDTVLSAMGHQLELTSVERPSSVDETLVASYLRLSPAERLAAFQESHASLARLRALARDHG